MKDAYPGAGTADEEVEQWRLDPIKGKKEKTDAELKKAEDELRALKE
jgi:hypothetical protein